MLFQFVGGLGMFLYGMDTMARGLQQAAGGKMKQWLAALTSNRLMGVLAGALITAVIQSSSATTVMVVGFVNAGLMNLQQAVGVIMGANIGTTITSWLVSMNEWGSALNPEFFAPLLIGIGALLIMFAKKERQKLIGEILLGFGLLFVGLDFMSSSVDPYSDSPIFSQIFLFLGSNPILGILAGAVITAILQSSSASVGILQTMAINGVVSWRAAVFITLGQNIGTCVTALLASAGAQRNAKRAAVIHLFFNVFGAILFGILFTVVFLLYPELGAAKINSVQISVFHTVFNISNTLILFPFGGLLVKLAQKILPLTQEEISDPIQSVRQRLSEYRTDTPAFALEAATYEVLAMGAVCLDNVQSALTALEEGRSDVDEVFQKEETINYLEEILTEFLIRLNSLPLNMAQSRMLRNLLYTINDLERVGDHAENLAELAQGLSREGLTFSQKAREELVTMGDTVMTVLEHAFLARSQYLLCNVDTAEELEERVDDYEEEYRAEHIDRLARGECSASAGVLFLDALSNLERISDHAVNIAQYVRQEIQPDGQRQNKK